MVPGASPGRALGYERMLFFSDAVFAIAITLLVLDLKLPPAVAGGIAIGPVIPKLFGFGISFYVISLYWLAHHRLFESITGHDRALLRTNLVFLASIAFLPFPTSVVAEYRDSTAAVIFYALSVATVGGLLVLLTLVARRPALMAPGATRGGTWRMVCRSLGAPLVFIATSVIAARYDPGLAMRCWLALVVVVPLAERIGRVFERRIDGG